MNGITRDEHCLGYVVLYGNKSEIDPEVDQINAELTKNGLEGYELSKPTAVVAVTRAAKDKKYAKSRKEILAKYGLKVHAISNHLAGQLVCDPNDDARSDIFAPKSCKGNAQAKRKWAIQEMKNTARAAKNIGVKVVNGFTGS